MNMMPREYVAETDGVHHVGGTRVSLDSLVYLYREGMSAEGMVESFPALTLEQVHGALAYYLANRKEFDAHLLDRERTAETEHQESRRTNAEVINKLRRVRDENPVPGRR